MVVCRQLPVPTSCPCSASSSSAGPGLGRTQPSSFPPHQNKGAEELSQDGRPAVTPREEQDCCPRHLNLDIHLNHSQAPPCARHGSHATPSPSTSFPCPLAAPSRHPWLLESWCLHANTITPRHTSYVSVHFHQTQRLIQGPRYLHSQVQRSRDSQEGLGEAWMKKLPDGL